MIRVTPLLKALFVGIAFTTLFWILLAASLGARTVQASSPYAAPPPAPGDVPPPDPYGSAAISTAVTFGPIQVVTNAAALPPGQDLPRDLGRALALAMDINPADIVSATLMCDGSVCTDPAAAAVMGLAPGTWYPTRGRTFALLSTGTISGLPSTAAYGAAASGPGVVEVTQYGAQEELHGMKNAEGGDLVRLHLGLRPPLTATCMALDFTFYTADLPYTATLPLAGTGTATGAGSPATGTAAPAGDIFTAQVNAADLRIDHGAVAAPGNIAFNAQNEVVASSTMSPAEIYASLAAPAGANIAGLFPLLQLRQPVKGGKPLDLYLSIQDRGDAFGDSAVALDNFAWLANTGPADCRPQAGHSGDRDGDGLPDGWEQYGTFQGDGHNGVQFLDLKAWGANPDVKDVFVEVDAMRPLTPGGYDPRPRPDAIAQIVAAFAHAPVDPLPASSAGSPQAYKGIHLHVDYGENAPLDWAGPAYGPKPQWKKAAGGSVLANGSAEYLCGTECAHSLDMLWNKLDDIKRDNFSAARAAVFHYTLFAHRLGECTAAMMLQSSQYCGDNGQVSGISKNLLPTGHGASDLVVSLGAPDWQSAYPTPTVAQAGTFMHELGHNLGLNHYGTVESQDPLHVMNKPNHLSVMNYLYQTTGLIVTDTDFLFDYSRYNMATLDESALWESQGISLAASGINVTYTVGVRYKCRSDDERVAPDAAQVNWDCDPGGIIQETPVSANISGDFDSYGGRVFSKLAVTDEWDQLVFTGGMLNRQRSMLPPLVLVRTPPPTPATQTTPPPPAAAPPPGPRLLVLHAPIGRPAAAELYLEALKAKQ